MGATVRGATAGLTAPPGGGGPAAWPGAAAERDGAPPTPRGGPPSVADVLFREPYRFDFFQAVRLLIRLRVAEVPVGRAGSPGRETIRFRGRPSLAFPASAVHDLSAPAPGRPVVMTVNFMGLTGPCGVLPVHYTERLLRHERGTTPERGAARAWFELFEHRLIAFFYRAREKYRFAVPFERGEADGPEPDAFTAALLSLVGLGTAGLRGRLSVRVAEPAPAAGPGRVLARVDDLALLHYAGLLRQRPRSAAGLAALVAGYFGLPLCVLQFQGQWLRLEPSDQSRPGARGVNHQVGVSLVAGDRVWDLASKFRLRIGPVGYAAFAALLPDPAPVPERKAFFLLVHLVRLYVGPELDFDVQLVLRAAAVPPLCVGAADGGPGAFLGWNTWVGSHTPDRDAEDAVFAGVAPTVLAPAVLPKENARGAR